MRRFSLSFIGNRNYKRIPDRYTGIVLLRPSIEALRVYTLGLIILYESTKHVHICLCIFFPFLQMSFSESCIKDSLRDVFLILLSEMTTLIDQEEKCVVNSVFSINLSPTVPETEIVQYHLREAILHIRNAIALRSRVSRLLGLYNLFYDEQLMDIFGITADKVGHLRTTLLSFQENVWDMMMNYMTTICQLYGYSEEKECIEEIWRSHLIAEKIDVEFSLFILPSYIPVYNSLNSIEHNFLRSFRQMLVRTSSDTISPFWHPHLMLLNIRTVESVWSFYKWPFYRKFFLFQLIKSPR